MTDWKVCETCKLFPDQFAGCSFKIERKTLAGLQCEELRAEAEAKLAAAEKLNDKYAEIHKSDQDRIASLEAEVARLRQWRCDKLGCPMRQWYQPEPARILGRIVGEVARSETPARPAGRCPEAGADCQLADRVDECRKAGTCSVLPKRKRGRHASR